MFSKTKTKSALKLISALGLSVALWACSNKEKEGEGIAVQLSYDAKCLEGLSDRVSQWSKGLGRSIDIQQDINCIGHAMDYFLRRVRGADFNQYTNVEVFHILQKFFNAKDFNQQIVDDILEVKTWVLGGESSVITREELQKLSVFLQKTHPILSELTPVAYRLFFNPNPKDPQKTTDFTVLEATQIRSNISKIIENLNDASEEEVRPIDVDRAHLIIDRIAQHFEFNFIDAEDLKKYWSVINIALGQELQAHVSLTPRSKIYKYIEKAYFLAIRLKYGVIDSGWRNPVNFTHLEPILEEAIPLVEEWISNQQDQVLTRQRVLKLFEIIVDVIDMPELDEPTREMLVDRFYTRFFQVQDSLDVKNFRKLKVEWNEFRNFQHNTEVFHGQRFDGSLMSLGLSQSLSSHNQMALDFMWPMLSDNEGYVLTDLHPRKIEANYGNLFKINWHRALARVFIIMYSDDPIRRSLLTGVTLEELERGYADVWQFLKALDILSDDDIGGWFRIFNEANLFVPRATPDAYLSYVEGVDYFAVLFSGLEFSGRIQTEMRKQCEGNDKNCDLQWIKDSPADFWSPMIPQFGHYLRSGLSSAEWNEWADGMEEMARKVKLPEEFSRSQLLAVTIAAQYIEVFLRKYDLNQDELIDFKETVNSFENFKAALLALPQIQGTQAEDDPQILLAVYSFFLRNGRLPNEIFGQPVELLGWLRRVQRCTVVAPDGSITAAANVSNCDYKSSRSKLMKILAFLSNAI